MENTTKPLPPWANEIPVGAFISYETTYKVGEYFSLFKKEHFQCPKRTEGNRLNQALQRLLSNRYM